MRDGAESPECAHGVMVASVIFPCWVVAFIVGVMLAPVEEKVTCTFGQNRDEDQYCTWDAL